MPGPPTEFACTNCGTRLRVRAGTHQTHCPACRAAGRLDRVEWGRRQGVWAFRTARTLKEIVSAGLAYFGPEWYRHVDDHPEVP